MYVSLFVEYGRPPSAVGAIASAASTMRASARRGRAPIARLDPARIQNLQVRPREVTSADDREWGAMEVIPCRPSTSTTQAGRGLGLGERADGSPSARF